MNGSLRPVGSVLALIGVAVGVGFVGYARWTRPVQDGDAALTNGQFERALTAYATAERRFDAWPPTRQAFAADYNRVVANQMWILYRLGRYDEAVDKAEHAPEAALPHFWSGVSFFQKARVEEKPEARLGWLTRAEEEFRKAIESDPDDWDTKYDFELTTRLAAELRKEPKTPPAQLMQLLRPPPPTSKAPRRVG
jgi:tetratricopeptide (TPR) repeat protein